MYLHADFFALKLLSCVPAADALCFFFSLSLCEIFLLSNFLPFLLSAKSFRLLQRLLPLLGLHLSLLLCGDLL